MFLGESILVIGGNEDEESLNPLLIHINDNEIEFDMCRNENYPKRQTAYGNFIDDTLVVCGGIDLKVNKLSIHI